MKSQNGANFQLEKGKDMDTHQMLWNEKVAKDIIKHLEKRRMEGTYAPTIAQARKEIVAMIPEGATVFQCGSMTTVDMGFWEDIASLQELSTLTRMSLEFHRKRAWHAGAME